MYQRNVLVALFLGLLPALGCKQEQAAAPPPPRPPEVVAAVPIVQPVTDYEVFTGRTEASERAELRARVTGYLEKTSFTEGALVEAGAVLFHIDDRPYRAEQTRAEANLLQARSQALRADKDYERAQSLLARQAISREEYDKLAADRDVAHSAIGVAEATVELAKLNVRYTDVRAPFSGRISRRMVDPGNLVKADETVLTTLVASDPMYAYFDVDERTLLRQLMREGRLESAQSDKTPILIGLADESGFPHRGAVNFVDNRVDPNTGTMWMRGEFEQPKRQIKPGIFVRVRFPLGQPHEAVLVAEQAIGTDQGQKFVYVVDEQNRVEYRQVTTGRMHEGLREVVEGLKANEKIVVTGLQRVRAKAEVAPKLVEMKSLVVKAPTDEEPAVKPAPAK